MKRVNRRKITALLTGTFIAVNCFSVPTFHTELYIKNAYNLTAATVCASSYDDKNYSSFMQDTSVKVPIKDKMVPQGLTKVDDRYLISSYDYEGSQKSTIYVCDKDGNLENECNLDMRAHVGGISYDKNNDLIWVAASNGYVNAYNTNEMLSNKENHRICSLNVGKGCKNYMNPLKNSISYLTVDGNYLYVGSFSLFKNGVVKKYLIENNNGEINLSLERKFKVPTKVQGMTIYRKNNKEYLILSRSFGENSPSVIQIFTFKDDINDYSNPLVKSVCYKTDAMIEQIIIDENNLYALFESSAYPYRYSSSSADNLESTDMSLILLPK